MVKTLADDRAAMEAMRELARHPTEYDPTNPEMHVRAPCCRRWMPACAIVDLRGIETIIRGGNYLPARDHDFACTDCIALLVLDEANDWNYANLWAALGAPDEWIRRAIARHLQHAERLADWAAGRGHSEDESHRKHYRSTEGMDPKTHPLAQPPRRTGAASISSS